MPPPRAGAHLGALQAVVGTLSAAGVERGGGEAAAGAERGGEAVRGDLRAIGAARQRLQPLVQRAWELAEEHATLAKLSGGWVLWPQACGLCLWPKPWAGRNAWVQGRHPVAERCSAGAASGRSVPVRCVCARAPSLAGVGPLQPSVTGRVVLGSTDNIMLPFP